MSSLNKGAEEVTVSFQIPKFAVALMERFPVAASYVKWLVEACYNNPIHLAVEVVLIVLLLYILFKRPGKKRSKLATLPPNIVQELIDEYQPEPLCPPLSKASELILSDSVILEEKPAKYTKIRGSDKTLLNAATMDFLGLGQRKEIHDAASAALDKYGCGSCGPRGFYGSIDVHVYLEQNLAKFFGTEEAIVYSDANSTASSAIPAFSNRADLLVVDDGCNDSIMTGVNLSRSRVLFFKHNNMEDLERVLSKVKDEDKRLKRNPQRRFIVVEGLYRNFGDVAPLDKVLQLKKQYLWRLFLDESHSVGVFGPTGRGVAEQYGIPIKEVDVFVASLSTTLASVGGFCAGTHEVVEHQRLSGAGYCFSASSPPFVSTAASAALEVIDSEGKTKLLPKLKQNSEFIHAEINRQGKNYVETVSDKSSALVHVRLADRFRYASSRLEYDAESRYMEESVLLDICKEVRNRGFLVCMSKYVTNEGASKTIGSSPRPALPPPSLRIAVTSEHEQKELADLASVLCEVASGILDKAPTPVLESKGNDDKTQTSESGLKKRK
mmetsp:Transcript_9257/g.16224  ORF Transcript_9257/g.16224 Transcript_9257/m.16224 type:complete len:553 (-) Transcript_9257:38-1696(-)